MNTSIHVSPLGMSNIYCNKRPSVYIVGYRIIHLKLNKIKGMALIQGVLDL